MNIKVKYIKNNLDSSSVVHVERSPWCKQILNSIIRSDCLILAMRGNYWHVVIHHLPDIAIVLVLHVVPHDHIKTIIGEHAVESDIVLRMILWKLYHIPVKLLGCLHFIVQFRLICYSCSLMCIDLQLWLLQGLWGFLLLLHPLSRFRDFLLIN